jgi:restriction system protein
MVDCVELSPAQFEETVEKLLREWGVGLDDFRVERLDHLSGGDGKYEIDVTASFRALGAEVRVLIECKHHKNPIRREVVQVLHQKLLSLGAHKGMIFATSAFQKAAIQFAQAHGIALVQLTDGRPTYWSKGTPDGPVASVAEASLIVGWVVMLNAQGEEVRSLLSPTTHPTCCLRDSSIDVLDRRP